MPEGQDLDPFEARANAEKDAVLAIRDLANLEPAAASIHGARARKLAQAIDPVQDLG